MARLSLDTTDLLAGEYTLLLGVAKGFAGGVHSDAVGFKPDHFGAFTLAIGQPCSTDTDGDGVSDADETTFGSDPSDDNSTPESSQWVPAFELATGGLPTCVDGVDNDGDGQIDDADVGCGDASPPTQTQPTATSTTSTPAPTLTSVAGATSAPTATATIPVPATGGPPTGTSGNAWLIVLYVAGGVIAAMTTAGAASWRLRRRAAKAK